MSYWNNKGTYEAEAATLQALVPAMGTADTFKGELWRAASKIYYDYFNNGFGNFWKEPAAFLITHIDFNESVLYMLFDHANGNMGCGCEEDLEAMINAVIEQLRGIDDTPNTQDMWEFKIDWELARKFRAEEVEEEDDWEYEEDEY